MQIEPLKAVSEALSAMSGAPYGTTLDVSATARSPLEQALYGSIWPYMTLYGSIWPYMALYSSISPYMALYGSI
jgi:hypothetical protein